MDEFTISRSECVERIKASNGTLFLIEWVKKDGTTASRQMRWGIPGMAWGTLKYDPESRGLLCLYDNDAQSHRMVQIATIRYIQFQDEMMREVI